MAIEPPDVEILVHVDAPSRVADDATYRQLAQAYLAFDPGSRGCVSRIGTDEQAASPTSHSSSGDQRVPGPRQEFTRLEQAIVVDSQELSFQSALDNRESPRLPPSRAIEADDEQVIPSSLPEHAGSPRSWRPLPSQISDSYPMPNASIYVSPTRLLQRFMGRQRPSPISSQQSSSLGEGETRITASPSEIHIPSSIPEPAQEDDPVVGDGCTNARKIVPVTPLAPTANKRQASVDIREDDANWDTTHITVSDVSANSLEQPSSMRYSEPPRPSKKTRVEGGQSAHAESNAGDLVRSSDATLPTHPSPSFPGQDTLGALEIRPPSPPVGVATIQPDDLVPEKLARLAAQLSSRYRPVATRDVQPFERGYWLVDCTTWTPEKLADTWTFLASYVGGGLAGWGVWCRRDDNHAWIRLYCWGHLVKHTYLLLYLASGRHLKLTGGEWRGGDGEVAVTVPPHEKQAPSA